ncbi:MAG: TetR-like C-terminal domain-containing protein [Opitutales bacterium]
MGRNFGSPLSGAPAEPCIWSGDLQKDLHAHARRYEQLLTENLALIRTMIGEIRHHGDHERQVFKAIFRPLREALAARLTQAVQGGELPAESSVEILADLFNAMIFTGVLRRTGSQPKLAYSATSYVNAAVDLIAGGAGRTS